MTQRILKNISDLDEDSVYELLKGNNPNYKIVD
jgi:hypothetical protein